MKYNVNRPENPPCYVCSECGAEVSIKAKRCAACGADVNKIGQFDDNRLAVEDDSYEQRNYTGILSGEQSAGNFNSGKRYPALRSIISWYKLLAWLILIGAAIISLFAGFIFNVKQSVPFITFTLFFGIVGFTNFMALGEGILVFLDIEQNTRVMSDR